MTDKFSAKNCSVVVAGIELKGLAEPEYHYTSDKIKYNWKRLLDKWVGGIPMKLDELECLSERMECSMDEKYWIDLEIEKKKVNLDRS